MDTSNKFGKILRQLREDNGLSQEDLGTELGEKTDKYFNKSTISRWENGSRKPDIETIKDLEEILGANSGMLLRAAGYLVEVGSDNQSSYIDLVIIKKREEHHQRLTDVANRLLDSDLNRVMKWVSPTGKVEFQLFDESESHLQERLTADDLSDRLEENLLSVYREYGEYFYKSCFLPHLYAEWSEDLRTKMSKALFYEQPYELIEALRLLVERKTFKGKCPVCKDWG